MMLIEKIATATDKKGKNLRKARRWLDKGDKDKDDQIDPDGQSRRGFSGKGGGFGETMGGNTGGITFGDSGGYRRPT